MGFDFAASASAFVAGSQVGVLDGGEAMLRRWRVRTCGIVCDVPSVFAK